ncbi:hypothetical protein ASPCAL13575 [Aspergillus calidoustus]|uniref:Tachykinin family protein n=1 Tax=Aspergillus calidoustus TaxID=454130 RepID=A0A0U5GHZ2_ASPCI|nr:hypothetical protein ASPCAL13575 [Aspergillus calidoustus]
MSDISSPPSSSTYSSQDGWSSKSEASSPDSAYSDQPSIPEKPTPECDSQPAEFFFVDPKDNGKTSSQFKQKQAFLMKRYHRERKQAAIQRLKTAKSDPSEKRVVLLNRPTLQPARQNKNKDLEERPSGDDEESVPSSSWVSTTYLSQGFKDPFDSYAVSMTDSMHRYLNHFRIHGVGAAYPLNVTMMGQYLWRNIVTIPALVNIFCFFSARHVAMIESKAHGETQSVQTSIKSSFQFRGNVLKYLNDLMRDPDNAVAETTIYAIASFVTIESSMGNVEAVMAHQTGLRRIVRLLGGVDALPHMTLSKLYQCDVKSAVLRNTQPIFPMSARFRSEICHESDIFQTNRPLPTPPALKDLGSRFTSSFWFASLDRRMRASIKIVRRLIIYFENASLHPELGVLTDNDIFVVTEHQLLSLTFSTADERRLNEPLRLCLLLYLNLRVWHLQGLPILDSVVVSLQEHLASELLYLHSVAPELTLWMLFMGGMASGGRGGTLHPWFLAQLLETGEFLGVRDWSEAMGIFAGFFYTDQPGVPSAEDLWIEALTAKQYSYLAPGDMV